MSEPSQETSGPRFSVVVPTYNRPDLLRSTIESVFAQTFADYELIVVDDGSTDDTPQVLASYGDRFRVIRQENAGQGVARNRGVEAASGEYIAFLDSDDLWLPWTLEAFDSALRTQRDPALLIATRQYFVDESEAGTILRSPAQMTLFDDFLTMQRGPHTPAGSGAMVVRRTEFERAGGFDRVRCNSEDVDLFLRLGESEGCLRLEAPITLACRQHEGNTSKDLARSREGTDYLLRREREGAYPGGASRWRDRWGVLTFQTRMLSLRLASAGDLTGAFGYYGAGFWANLRLGRVRYLTLAPMVILLRRVTRKRKRQV